MTTLKNVYVGLESNQDRYNWNWRLCLKAMEVEGRVVFTSWSKNAGMSIVLKVKLEAEREVFSGCSAVQSSAAQHQLLIRLEDTFFSLEKELLKTPTVRLQYPKDRIVGLGANFLGMGPSNSDLFFLTRVFYE